MRLIAGLLSCLAVVTLSDLTDDCVLGESCGLCIQRGAHCAWCMDPESSISARCQNRSRLESSGKCRKENIYQPVTELIPTEGGGIGSKNHWGVIVQLEPQGVNLKIKKGEKLSAKFKYKHSRPKDDPHAVNVQLQHSELPPELIIKFFMICDGIWKETKRCENVPDGQLVDIRLDVTLKDCSHATGTLSFSMGVVGYQAVTGIYVTPICGCECEILRYQEKASTFCSRSGSLICGQCHCDSGKGGNMCECPLASYGVTTAKALEDKCREKPGAPICGGNGKCRCGQCQCDTPTISGPFCSCDHTSCPVGDEGRQCSGRGVCECGKCKCESGWSREDCSCEENRDKCTENGEVCSKHGHCECGRCVCDQGYTGAFCGSEETNADAENDLNKDDSNDAVNKDDQAEPTMPSVQPAFVETPAPEPESQPEPEPENRPEDAEKAADADLNELEPVQSEAERAELSLSNEDEIESEEQRSSASSIAATAIVLVIARLF